MTSKKRYLILIFVAQVCGVLLWFGYIKSLIVSSTPLDSFFFFAFYGIPIIISSVAGFFTSVLLPIKVNFRSGCLCSFPTAFVYLLVYVILPFIGSANLIPGNLPERIGFFLVNLLTFYLPLTALILTLDTFAVWVGSLLHAKLVKQRDEPID